MSRDPDGFPFDPDPLHPDDWFTNPDPRVPTSWEHQRAPRRNRGCLWAILGCLAFWALVALAVWVVAS